MKDVGLVVKNVVMIMPVFTSTAHLNALTKGLKTLRYPTSRTYKVTHIIYHAQIHAEITQCLLSTLMIITSTQHMLHAQHCIGIHYTPRCTTI